uniref:SRPBCC family protein n=1 Tax=Janibacter limosus TaxID=53458 RepID=A0AC61U507_9MICO|nr:SRPBCC family protein [Janibacter limosus]
MGDEAAPTHDWSGTAPVRWTTTAPRERVWSVIEDGWTYAAWVVGASRVRSVDESWPAEGTQLHHSVGVWPLVRDDRTSVVEVDPAQMRIVLRGASATLRDAARRDRGQQPAGRDDGHDA